MNEEYVNALAEVVKTFLSFSNEWLEDEIIDQETYTEITMNKKKFIEEFETWQG